MLSNKTKYLSIATFITIAICFLVDGISLISGLIKTYSMGDSLGGGRWGFLVFEIITQIVLIANAILGIVILLKGKDRGAAFRRMADEIGCLALFFVSTVFYVLYMMNELGGLSHVPPIIIVVIIFSIFSFILAILASIKKIRINFLTKCIFAIVSSGFVLVTLVILLVGANPENTLSFILYIFLTFSLVAAILSFVFFMVEDRDDRQEALIAKAKETETQMLDDDTQIIE
jgi:hypothetical protein